MRDHFVTDEDGVPTLWQGTPDNRGHWGYERGVLQPAVWDAARAVLAPDDAVEERGARALHEVIHNEVPWDLFSGAYRDERRRQVRAVLAAIREEAGR
jgi:hypothetical protein